MSIWQKVRSMLTSLFVNLEHQHDFVHLCGDDTYLIVDNLRHFVASPAIQLASQQDEPVLMGGPIMPFWIRWLANKKL